MISDKSESFTSSNEELLLIEAFSKSKGCVWLPSTAPLERELEGEVELPCKETLYSIMKLA
jgi:hypothetical protein